MKLIVEISGGNVVNVYGDKIEGLEVILHDFDNIDAGDEDPMPKYYVPEKYYL